MMTEIALASWFFHIFMLLGPVWWTSRTADRPHARATDEVLSGRGG